MGTTKDIGNWGEQVAREHLEALGYRVLWQARSGGPDLVCEKDGQVIAAEVKTARDAGQCWKTAPVHPLRRLDDMVAIVMPNRKVHVCSMAEHLAAADRSTRRSVSQLVREYCPEAFTQAGLRESRNLRARRRAGADGKYAREEIVQILRERGERIA
jgi:Holliday junction resolvase-like predicted endonuclease